MKKKLLAVAVSIFALVFLFLVLIRLGNSPKKEDEGNSVKQGNLLDTRVNESSLEIREPAVASSFYSANPNELSTNLQELLSGTEKVQPAGKVRILIVPHAGLTYSGGVAGAGFKQLENLEFKRAILLGVNHKMDFSHVAVYNQGAWKTPLGETDIDEDFANLLIDGKSILSDFKPHEEEHSLEIELLFLQKLFPDIKIVPILLSRISDGGVNLLAQKIAYNFDDETIIIVSSDLSHYPDWEDANKADAAVVNAILTGKESEFAKEVKNIETAGYKNLSTPACGQNAIRIALKVSELLGIDTFKKIKYENSGDVTQDKSRVVGYAAVTASSEDLVFKKITLDSYLQKEALNIARQTLSYYLKDGTLPKVEISSPLLKEPLGVFVTLEEKGSLRGCMGTFETSEPLYKVIQDTAVLSATKDKRFNPVAFNELNDIRIELSIMTPRKKIETWKNINLGKDGVVIEKAGRSGTFLPQVAVDNGWDLTKFLQELCFQKAGLSQDCYQDSATKIYTFEAQVFGEK